MSAFVGGTLFTVGLLLFGTTAWAEAITSTQASHAADAFFQDRFPAQPTAALASNAGRSRAEGSLSPLNDEQGTTIGYLRQYTTGGYVVLRADTLCPPTKIFSPDGVFSELPPAFSRLVQLELAGELRELRAQATGGGMSSAQKIGDSDYPAQWARLLSADADATVHTEAAGVELLAERWHQNAAYNHYAPVATGGPGGRAYAGCVACAMAMVLHYYRSPTAVFADRTYSDVTGSCVGSHSISDAGLTAYDWGNMPSSIKTSSPLAERQAIGQLLYHCGVAVSMNFEAAVSTAQSAAIPGALSVYFNYSSSALLGKGNYTPTAWFALIQTDIDAGKPIIWSMWDVNGNAGHCVVVDGYRGANEVHFNLGWSGSGNAWCNLDAAVPPDAWVSHAAIFGITPRTDAAKIGTLTVDVSGTASSVAIAVTPVDINGLAPGVAPFSRRFAAGATVTLSAPKAVKNSAFAYWRLAERNDFSTTISIDIGGIQSCTAVYVPSPVPANDDFAEAIAFSLTDYAGTLTGSNAAASSEAGEPRHAGLDPYATLWWSVRPAIKTTLSLTTHGSALDTVLAVYTGSSVSTLTRIAENDDDGSCGNGSGVVAIEVEANQQYYVVVGGATDTAVGDIVLNWSRPDDRGKVWTSGSVGGAGYRFASTVSIGSAGGTLTLPIELLASEVGSSGTGAGVLARLNDPDTHGAVTWASVDAGGGPPFCGSPTVRVEPNPSHSSRRCTLELSCENALGLSGPVLVQAGRPMLPDFLITSLALSPAKPAPGDVVTVLVTAKNDGSIEGKVGVCRISIDDETTPAMELVVGTVPVGESRTFTLRFTTSGLGDHVLHAVLDAVGGIAEEDETNNTVDVAFSVSAPGMPVITTQPIATTVNGGTTLVLKAAASGDAPLSYQWLKGGAAIMAATDSLYTVTSAAGHDAGNYSLRITNAMGSIYSKTVAVTVPNPGPSTAARLANLSVRAPVGPGDQTLVVGFYVNAIVAKQVLLRGIGPGLTPFGVTSVIPDPALRLYFGAARIDENDDWGGSDALAAVFNSVGAFVLPPTSKDAVLYCSLAPGAYSAHLTTSSEAGVAMVEVYDADHDAGKNRFTNVSARNQVGTADQILVLGFVLTGDSPKTLLIRGVGPGLSRLGVSGVLADPQLKVYVERTVIATNDNWGSLGDSTSLAAAAAQVAAFDLARGSKDAVLFLVLPPGGYTAQVIGANGTAGIALIEVYEFE